MDKIIQYTTNAFSGSDQYSKAFFDSFKPTVEASEIMGIESPNLCINSFKDSLVSTDPIFSTIPSQINPGLETYEYFLFEQLEILNDCSLKILDTVYLIGVIHTVWGNILELKPTTIPNTDKKLLTNATYDVILSNPSCGIKRDILETHYKTRYLSGISSFLGISSGSLLNMLNIQNITSNDIIPSDTKITINNATAVNYYIPSSTKKREIIAIAKNLFVSISPLFVYLFFNKLNINEINIENIQKIVESKVTVFENELTKMLDDVVINETTSKITIPIWMNTLVGTNAWSFDENILLKIYTDIITRLIVYYSASLARDHIYDIYDLKTIQMPDGYNKDYNIVYPTNIYNTTIYIKNERCMDNTIIEDVGNTRISNYTEIGFFEQMKGKFIILIIIIIAIIIGIYYYFKTK